MTSISRDDATLLHAALEAAALPLCVLDRTGVVRVATPAWPTHAPGAAAYGAAEGFNYLKSLQHLAEQGVAHARLLHDGIAAVLAGRAPQFRLEHPALDGERRQVLEAAALPDGGAVVTHLDVTNAHAAELRHRRLLQRYRAVTHDARAGVWELDPLRQLLNVDASLCELLGYPDGGARSWTEWRARLHPEDIPAIDALWGRCTAERQASGGEARIGPFEVRLADTRGGYRAFDCLGVIVRDAAGAVIAVHGTLHDVTERRSVQEAMLRSNRHLQELARRLAQLEAGSAEEA
ncbi:MAG: PAS domain-containing protein [Longimicrobiales bacterium]